MRTVLDIGEALVRWRRAAGLTQGDVATRVGVARQQVQRWEAAAYRNVSLERVSAVAEAIGFSVGAGDASLLAAEATAPYSASGSGVVLPVKDLGEVAARVRAHAEELQRRFGVRSVGVFGSFARGEQTPQSDVDLVVEVEDPSLETVFGAESRLGEILGRDVESGSIGAVSPRVRDDVAKDLVHVWTA